jgi:hypothetical protein
MPMFQLLVLINLLLPVTFLQKELPIKTVERIFNSYVENSESTDSPDNKDAMREALLQLQHDKTITEFELLINVWMYYDPTDFATRDLVEPILLANKDKAAAAIEKRMQHKKKWEQTDHAPYSELWDLKKKLEKN